MEQHLAKQNVNFVDKYNFKIVLNSIARHL